MNPRSVYSLISMRNLKPMMDSRLTIDVCTSLHQVALVIDLRCGICRASSSLAVNFFELELRFALLCLETRASSSPASAVVSFVVTGSRPLYLPWPCSFSSSGSSLTATGCHRREVSCPRPLHFSSYPPPGRALRCSSLIVVELCRGWNQPRRLSNARFSPSEYYEFATLVPGFLLTSQWTQNFQTLQYNP
ncbi:hypothetical protein YC2023_100962 [Brassica napus]